MTAADPEALLRDARARAATRAQHLSDGLAGIVEAAESANLDDEHDPEGATVGFERAQVAALLERAQERLAELDAAHERLRNGSYGICEGCGAAIPAARLEAQPATRRCVPCSGAANGRRDAR